jgi:hypothetical protein
MRRARRSHAPARARLLLASLAAIAAVVALAACGGGGATTAAAVSDGARLAPASVPAYAEIDTTVGGAEWRRADALLQRLPAREDLLKTLERELAAAGLDWERDVRPALGDTLYLVRLDPSRKGTEVGYTRPAEPARFDDLLDRLRDPELVHRRLGPWTLFAESQGALDRFEQLRADEGTLADEDWFREATDPLPASALARVVLDGAAVQQALEASSRDGMLGSLAPALGSPRYLAAALAAGSDGIELTGATRVDDGAELGSFVPGLPERIPSGALVYVGFGDVQPLLRRALASAESGNLAFSLGRAAVEAALGLTVEDDVLPLFGREGALALYPGTGGKPRVALYLGVDTARARSLLDRLGRADLGPLGEDIRTRTFRLDGTDVLEVSYPKEHVRLLAAVADGMLVITGDEETLRDSLDGGPSLADDAGYRRARSVVPVPREVTGLLYADVSTVLAERRGADAEPLPKSVRESMDALGPLLAYGEQDGSELMVHGLVAVQ